MPDGEGQDRTTRLDSPPGGHTTTVALPLSRASRDDSTADRERNALPVAQMATLAPPTGPARDHEAAAPDAPRDEKYQLGRTLGRGGMGIVRETRDLPVGRLVAMKTLHEGAEADPRLADLLVREARLTGQLEHPSIVPIYDLGRLSNGEVFYTMRLYPSNTLAQILDRLKAGDEALAEAYPEKRLLQIFRQVCMAVAYAHSRGVVHRDLKPSNILVGDYGDVEVTDWGVAEVTADATVNVEPLAAGGEDAGRTPRGADEIVGTPTYMAPEQIVAPQIVEPLSDIYSLGVLLYQIVTLELPYDTSGHLRDLVSQVIRGQLQPPETRNPDKNVSRALGDIIRKALALAPRERYATAIELWRAVDALVQGADRRKRQEKMARREVALGEEAALRYFERLDEQRDLRERIAALQADLKPWAPLSAKRRIWQLRDEHDRLDVFLGEAFSEATNHHFLALLQDGNNAMARAALARLYWTRLEPAMEHEDYRDIVFYGRLVKTLGEPGEGPLRVGSGTLSVRTMPAGAQVWLTDAVALPEEPPEQNAAPYGIAPLMDLTLDSGIYVVTAKAEGYRESRRPVIVRAGETLQILLTLPPLDLDRPMVGRDGELGRLKSLFESASENRRPVFTLVKAAPGMGKTKLLDAFEGFLHRNPKTISVCYAEPRRTHPQLPFAPLVDLIAFRAGIKLEDSRDVRRRKLVETVRLDFTHDNSRPLLAADRLLVEETAEDLGLLPGLLDDPTQRRDEPWSLRSELAPSQIRRRVFMGLRAYFERLGRAAPIYFRVRSADRLDPSTIEVLGDLKRRLRDIPMFLLADLSEETARPALLDLFDHILTLDPFDVLTVERFAAHFLDGTISPRLAETIARICQGRPDHIEAVLALLAVNDRIAPRDGRWVISGRTALDREELGFERTLRQLVYERLSPTERDVLRRAAVAGRVFSREELIALGVERPDDITATLVENEVFRPRPTAGLLWTEVFAFSSETLRSIAYRALPLEERRALHLRLAEHLARIPVLPPEGVALMADHYRNAGRPEDARRALDLLASHARDLDAREEENLNRQLAAKLTSETSTTPR